MNADINTQLDQAWEQKRNKERLQARLLDADRQLSTKRSDLRDLEKKLQAENRDVERLSHLSLTELFYTILGNKVEQLDKERQEALAAQLAYTKAKYAVEALEREIADLERELGGLPDVDALITRLLAEREALVIQSGGANAARLKELADQIQALRKQQKEIQEAVWAGNAALQGLESVNRSLGSAENWGVWDLLGGGMLATAAKHSRIDEARDQALDVQQALRRFQRELADVQADQSGLVVQLDGFERFADFFFDGLISDWIVQSRIQDSRNSVQNLLVRVSQILSNLQRGLPALEREIARLEADRQAFTEQSTR